MLPALATVVAPRPHGLTEAEVRARLETEGRNELPAPARTTFFSRVLGAVREPMSILLLAAAAVSGFGLGQRRESIGILAIVVLNAAIGIAQEGRAARALEALRALEAPRATVERDGVRRSVPAAELVRGDLIILSAGDRVPADVRLTAAFGIEVDESLLTGESLPVGKRAGEGDEETHVVFAGTHVTRGSARGDCIRTGSATSLGGIASHLDQRNRATPLQLELRALATKLGSIAIAIACGVFILTVIRFGFSARSLQESFLGAVALAVAAIPEGLPTVVTIGLALGVRRMVKQNVIVRRLSAVETLGAATVILSDKTGTLTENRMQVDGVWTANGGRPDDVVRDAIARAAVLCNDAAAATRLGDPIELALLDAFADAARTCPPAFPRVAEIPFASERMRMTTVHETYAGSLVVVKGAPDVLVPLCARAMTRDGTEPLPALEESLAFIGELASTGARVLAFAERAFDVSPVSLEDAERDLTLLGFVAFRDPIRPGCAATVAEAAAAGVRVVMVTGDHPHTAMKIAVEGGLVPEGAGARAITGDDLRAHGIPDDPLEFSVYARVDPLQKLELVTALQARGHVLAVTGDGVNDAPALRRADIGVAIGNGSDVAREAADMIVTDGNLASIVRAIREGRGIYDNIRKVVDYLVAGNLSEITVVVASLFAFPALGVPFLPLQLLWVNLLTDGPPALALGIDRTDPDLMRAPPRAHEMRMITGARVRLLFRRAALLAAAPLGGGAIVGYVWHMPWVVARSEMFTILVIVHLLYAFVARAPSREAARRARPSPWLIAAVGMGIGLQVLVLLTPPLRSTFGMVALAPRAWLLAIGLGLLPPFAMRILERGR